MVCQMTRFKKRSQSSEAFHPPPSPSPTWMLLEERRCVPRSVVQPADGEVQAVPRHTEIANQLAKRICRGLSPRRGVIDNQASRSMVPMSRRATLWKKKPVKKKPVK